MLRRLLALLSILLAAPTLAADDPAIEEVRAAYASCNAHLAQQPDNWFGWRRVFDGGYADIFEFWDQGSEGYGPSILKRKFLIDAIASEEQTFCYRPDGTLAFAFTQMTSPNMAQSTEQAFDSPSITREGRIYVDPNGKILRVLGKIIGAGVETTLEDDNYQLARGCWELDLTLTRDAVHTAYLHEMGDIDGTKPEHIPNLYDWCSAVEK